MGDCYALVADEMLTLAQPFPGDDRFDAANIRPELRFRVIRIQDITPEYIIHDYLTNKTVEISKSLLEKPHFNVGRWYAKRRDQEYRLDETSFQKSEMGPAEMDALSLT